MQALVFEKDLEIYTPTPHNQYVTTNKEDIKVSNKSSVLTRIIHVFSFA